jgi:2-haloalkanoic acid dehalogenase type II
MLFGSWESKIYIFLFSICLALCLVRSANTDLNQNDTIPCSTFDSKKIKLVTFDVFAALMDLDTSLKINIAEIVPTLSQKEVTSIAEQWENAYGSYAGTVFDESVTGPSPFLWVLETSLTEILDKMSISVTKEQFTDLIDAWGHLIPWPDTSTVLTQIYNAGFKVATLSNGDVGTLTTAMQIFAPNVSFSYYFSSDFPAGSFKPNEEMYKQVESATSLNPTQILHVAGASSDGWGARNAGLYSALLSSPPYPKPPLPCFLLKNITELPAVLGII